MSEGSIPAFGRMGFRLFLKTLRPPRLGETLEHLYIRIRRRRDAGAVEPVRTPVLESRAERAIREYLGAQAGNLERAARLKEKADRLERAGTPSESARNRAERACGEVIAGFAGLRASFVEDTGGKAGARAFDRAVELSCPAFAPYLSSAARR